jgi:hypothetical protein
MVGEIVEIPAFCTWRMAPIYGATRNDVTQPLRIRGESAANNVIEWRS